MKTVTLELTVEEAELLKTALIPARIEDYISESDAAQLDSKIDQAIEEAK